MHEEEVGVAGGSNPDSEKETGVKATERRTRQERRLEISSSFQ